MATNKILWVPNPPEGIPPPNEVLNPASQQLIRELVVYLRSVAPSVREEDLIGMAIQVVARSLEPQYVIKGKRVDVRRMAYCHSCALICVISTVHQLARAAGILPRVYCTPELVQRRVVEWRDRWFAEFRAHGGPGSRWLFDPPSDPRERELLRFAEWMAGRRVQPIDDFFATLQMAKWRAHRKKRRRRPDREELDRYSLLADAKLMLGDPRRFVGMLWIDAHGRLAIGMRQARDAMNEWVPREHCAAEVELEIHQPEEDEGQRALREVEENEEAEFVRRYRDERLAKVRSDSAAAVVLSNLERLASKDSTLADLAREHGLAPSTMTEAYQQETERLRRFARARGIA